MPVSSEASLSLILSFPFLTLPNVFIKYVSEKAYLTSVINAIARGEAMITLKGREPPSPLSVN